MVTGSLDYGQGHAAAFAQIVGSKLGISLEHFRLIQGDSDELIAGQGTGGHLFGINPGHGQESILTYRMQSDDPGAMMPELGRTLVHVEGVQLIADWIDDMAGDCG